MVAADPPQLGFINPLPGTTPHSPDPSSSTSRPRSNYLDTVEGETGLLQALLVHRPYGKDKHWEMLGIQAILRERDEAEWIKLGQNQVWDKIHELYDPETIEDQVGSCPAPACR